MGRVALTPIIESPNSTTGKYRLFFISFLAAGVGVGAGFIAYILYSLIALFTNIFFYQRLSIHFVSPMQNHIGLWVILVTTVGGLLIGLMAKYGSEQIIGHGIPEAREAVVANRSKIQPKVALLKPLSAALAIGSGGPFGAEGPIIQTGGAFGSLIGQTFHLTAAERKILLACGGGAGIAAIFNVPIGGAILAIELLLFEYGPRSFIPLIISCVLATGVRLMIMGNESVLTMGSPTFDMYHGWPYYLVLGLICGLAAVLFAKSLNLFEHVFERMKLGIVWSPVVGGAALGVLGYLMPRVLGSGYDTIGDILNNRLTLTILLLILVLKWLAMIVSLGSGTSGGTLAPMFMFSAALGGAFALIVDRLVPGAHLDPSAFALAAMGAVLGAASRATFTFFVIPFEITKNYDAVIPLMLVAVIATAVSMVFMKHSIMSEKLAGRGYGVPDDYTVDVLQQVSVSDVMEKDPPLIPSDTTIGALAERVACGDSSLTRHQAYLIVDKDGLLEGIVTWKDMMKSLSAEPKGDAPVSRIAANELTVAFPDERLFDAVARMLKKDVGRLPVVSPENHRKIVGYLGRGSVLSARKRRLEEENVQERGFLSWRLKPGAGGAPKNMKEFPERKDNNSF